MWFFIEVVPLKVMLSLYSHKLAIRRNMEILLKIIMCHLIGDYVLQCDFIAQTKGKNWYHLLLHCFLYILPFMLYLGMIGDYFSYSVHI